MNVQSRGQARCHVLGAIPLGVFVCIIIFEIRSLNWDPGLDQLTNKSDIHLAPPPQLQDYKHKIATPSFFLELRI